MGSCRQVTPRYDVRERDYWQLFASITRWVGIRTNFTYKQRHSQTPKVRSIAERIRSALAELVSSASLFLPFSWNVLWGKGKMPAPPSWKVQTHHRGLFTQGADMHVLSPPAERHNALRITFYLEGRFLTRFRSSSGIVCSCVSKATLIDFRGTETWLGVGCTTNRKRNLLCSVNLSLNEHHSVYKYYT